LGNPLVQEMVIDLSGSRPRIAYLRDVTLLRDAALIAADASRSAEGQFDPRAAVGQPPEALTNDVAGEGDAATSRPANAPRGRESMPAASRPASRASAGAARPAPNPGDADTPADVGSGAADAGGTSSGAADAHRIGRWTGG
jgi:hypothetical protein